MNIFDLIGPVMVGPSSSHTAGAVRIGLTARKLLADEPASAELLLHGSFADTGRGHGTDKALIAGLLGMEPDDTRIPESFLWAEKAGLSFRFGTISLPDAHPNSVLLRLRGKHGGEKRVVAASIGGGRIEVRRIDDMPLRFSAEQPTLIVSNDDQPGSVADVSRILADAGVNIGTFQVNRDERGGSAVMVIECDAPLEAELVERIRSLPGIRRAVCIN
ncbi:MAG: L-serine ammonia-lyase, iron-sulfur-dependent subunit beta [Oscillospiraceae bacterium]|nr:L-serine ammonia-lyase, iron-sulfur-dependent subunit beta [Oscillospiraceae bacterium]